MLLSPAFVTWIMWNRFKLIRKTRWPKYGRATDLSASAYALWKLHRMHRMHPLVSADKTSPGSRSKWHGIYRCFEAELFNLRWKVPFGLMLVINTYARRQTYASRMYEMGTQVVLERTAMRLRIKFATEIINYGARNWIKEDGKGKNDVVGDDIRNGNGRINFWRHQVLDRNYTPR